VPANGQPPATGSGEADEDDPDHLGN
jgi:hypothetical protein